MSGTRITSVDEVNKGETFLFTVTDGESELEAILVKEDDEIMAWENYCQHWTDVRLDKGDGARMRNGEIICEKHGAMFDKDTGSCTYGPCQGAKLDPVKIDIREGDIYLTDEDYDFVHRGECEEASDSEDWDIGSSRRGRDF